ncbi:hypothetical protein [Alteromonas sp. 14N.309.X.WAT.G.H12]|uniref:hypothetical protein n=1 Tax=Alteromonas sp. 14N.309.X.WAT.G.H12 TaxID=3120824 RepID=UPI002FD00598
MLKFSYALLFTFALFSFFANATVDDVVLEKSKPLSTFAQNEIYDFVHLSDIDAIKENVIDRLQRVLGMSKDEVDKVRVSRIYNTTWVQVSVDGKTYITDKRARQWLGTDLSELYLFEDAAKRISVGNDNRESLIDYAYFMLKLPSVAPIYPATSSPTGKQKLIFAFVDPSCPRCRDFHLTKMEQWRALGVTWVYIPFLISDDRKSEELAEYVYCPSDIDEVKKRIDEVYLVGKKKAAGRAALNDACGQKEKSVVTSILTAGFRHGLAGSPMFLTESGEVYYGTPSLEMSVINQLKE